jgi:hypothetical protein
MAMTDSAMLVAMMERRLLDQRGAVGRMNASERNGIRGTRRTESDCSESRRGQSRLHVIFSSKPQAGVACRPCFKMSDVSACTLFAFQPMPNVAPDRRDQPNQTRA